MNEIFRPPRKQLFTGLACALFFAGMAVACLVVEMVPSTPKLPAQGAIWVFCGIEAFWLGWLVLALYYLAAYWREELRVDGMRVGFRGVFRATTLDLSAVTYARWGLGSSGRLILRADEERLTIPFDFDGSPRLMEYLHQHIPLAVQVDWPTFHYEYLRPRVVGPDDVLVDRKRIDRYLFPGAMLCLAFALACGICGEMKGVTGGCVAAVFLFGMRYLFPAEEFHAPSAKASVRKEPEGLWLIGWLFLALFLLAMHTAAERWLKIAIPVWTLVVVVGFWVAGFVGLAIWSARCDIIRERKQKAEIEAEWNAEHASG